MKNIRQRRDSGMLNKLTAIVVSTVFLCQNVVWANPDGYKLAAPSRFSKYFEKIIGKTKKSINEAQITQDAIYFAIIARELHEMIIQEKQRNVFRIISSHPNTNIKFTTTEAELTAIEGHTFYCLEATFYGVRKNVVFYPKGCPKAVLEKIGIKNNVDEYYEKLLEGVWISDVYIPAPQPGFAAQEYLTVPNGENNDGTFGRKDLGDQYVCSNDNERDKVRVAERLKQHISKEGKTLKIRWEGEIIHLSIDKELFPLFLRDRFLTDSMINAVLNNVLRESKGEGPAKGANLNKLPRNEEGNIVIILSALNTSKYLFEDHVGNGFIGINKYFLGLFRRISENPQLGIKFAYALLQVCLEHEFIHELTGRGKEIEDELTQRGALRLVTLLQKNGTDPFPLAGALLRERCIERQFVELMTEYYNGGMSVIEIEDNPDTPFYENIQLVTSINSTYTALMRSIRVLEELPAEAFSRQLQKINEWNRGSLPKDSRAYKELQKINDLWDIYLTKLLFSCTIRGWTDIVEQLFKYGVSGLKLRNLESLPHGFSGLLNEQETLDDILAFFKYREQSAEPKMGTHIYKTVKYQAYIKARLLYHLYCKVMGLDSSKLADRQLMEQKRPFMTRSSSDRGPSYTMAEVFKEAQSGQGTLVSDQLSKFANLFGFGKFDIFSFIAKLNSAKGVDSKFVINFYPNLPTNSHSINPLPLPYPSRFIMARGVLTHEDVVDLDIEGNPSQYESFSIIVKEASNGEKYLHIAANKGDADPLVFEILLELPHFHGTSIQTRKRPIYIDYYKADFVTENPLEDEKRQKPEKKLPVAEKVHVIEIGGDEDENGEGGHLQVYPTAARHTTQIAMRVKALAEQTRIELPEEIQDLLTNYDRSRKIMKGVFNDITTQVQTEITVLLKEYGFFKSSPEKPFIPPKDITIADAAKIINEVINSNEFRNLRYADLDIPYNMKISILLSILTDILGGKGAGLVVMSEFAYDINRTRYERAISLLEGIKLHDKANELRKLLDDLRFERALEYLRETLKEVGTHDHTQGLVELIDRLERQFNYTVPRGIIYTTEQYKEREDIDNDSLNHVFNDEYFRQGGLVSVRSGAPISLPGAMPTILYCGLTLENIEKFQENNKLTDEKTLEIYKYFVRKFLDLAAGETVDNASINNAFRSAEDKIAELEQRTKNKLSVKRKAMAYLMEAANASGNYKEFSRILHSPLEQVKIAREKIFNYWEKKDVKDLFKNIFFGSRQEEEKYRTLGTAVVIQEMVLGPSGVSISRYNSTGERRVDEDTGKLFIPIGTYSDTAATVVSGKAGSKDISNLPPAIQQQLLTLMEIYSGIYRKIVEIEFTITNGTTINLLQVRPIATTAKAKTRNLFDLYTVRNLSIEQLLVELNQHDLRELVTAKAIDQDDDETSVKAGEQTPLEHNKSLQLRTASGRLVIAEEASAGVGIGKLIIKRPDEELDDLLTRIEEVEKRGNKAIVMVFTFHPKEIDMKIISKAAGIITRAGTKESHGAVMARRLGIPAITNLQIDITDDSVMGQGQGLKDGDMIAIDGNTGILYDLRDGRELMLRPPVENIELINIFRMIDKKYNLDFTEKLIAILISNSGILKARGEPVDVPHENILGVVKNAKILEKDDLNNKFAKGTYGPRIITQGDYPAPGDASYFIIIHGTTYIITDGKLTRKTNVATGVGEITILSEELIEPRKRIATVEVSPDAVVLEIDEKTFRDYFGNAFLEIAEARLEATYGDNGMNGKLKKAAIEVTDFLNNKYKLGLDTGDIVGLLRGVIGKKEDIPTINLGYLIEALSLKASPEKIFEIAVDTGRILNSLLQKETIKKREAMIASALKDIAVLIGAEECPDEQKLLEIMKIRAAAKGINPKDVEYAFNIFMQGLNLFKTDPNFHINRFDRSYFSLIEQLCLLTCTDREKVRTAFKADFLRRFDPDFYIIKGNLMIGSKLYKISQKLKSYNEVFENSEILISILPEEVRNSDRKTLVVFNMEIFEQIPLFGLKIVMYMIQNNESIEIGLRIPDSWEKDKVRNWISNDWELKDYKDRIILLPFNLETAIADPRLENKDVVFVESEDAVVPEGLNVKIFRANNNSSFYGLLIFGILYARAKHEDNIMDFLKIGTRDPEQLETIERIRDAIIARRIFEVTFMHFQDIHQEFQDRTVDQRVIEESV